MWQKMKNIYHLIIAFLAATWYGFSSRKLIVIGVTGTDGKTTTVHMIYEILKAAGKKVSMISTIQAFVGGRVYDTGFHVTTSDPIALQRFLKQAVIKDDKYFVLEVSSHGLDQNRVAFVDFAIGVLTTLTHEHLDYHKTFVNYAKAKFKLLHSAKRAMVIPHDGIVQDVKTYLDTETTWRDVTTFGLVKGMETQTQWKFKLKIPGDYNVLNALAAASVSVALRIDRKVIKKALEHFSGIPGRFEEFRTNRDFRVVIDFAHKPNALEQVLKTAREQVKEGGRVIVMYGCASERDVLKRSMMGEISGKLADITVLTDEDPRFEDSLKIIDEIAKGCIRAGTKEGKTLFKIPNRGKAIEFIMQKLARKNDLILLCGKGHEKSINYRGIEEPWSEHEAVALALK